MYVLDVSYERLLERLTNFVFELLVHRSNRFRLLILSWPPLTVLDVTENTIKAFGANQMHYWTRSQSVSPFSSYSDLIG